MQAILRKISSTSHDSSVFLAGENVEYKYCIVNGESHVEKWEASGGGNRKLVGDGDTFDDGKFGDMPAHARPKSAAPPPRQHSEHIHVDLGSAPVRVGSAKASKFDQAIIDGNNKAGSWRQKLEMCKNFFYEKSVAEAAGFNMQKPDTEHLAAIAIYLHFLNTGQVCAHARMYACACMCVCARAYLCVGTCVRACVHVLGRVCFCVLGLV